MTIPRNHTGVMFLSVYTGRTVHTHTCVYRSNNLPCLAYCATSASTESYHSSAWHPSGVVITGNQHSPAQSLSTYFKTHWTANLHDYSWLPVVSVVLLQKLPSCKALGLAVTFTKYNLQKLSVCIFSSRAFCKAYRVTPRFTLCDQRTHEKLSDISVNSTTAIKHHELLPISLTLLSGRH